GSLSRLRRLIVDGVVRHERVHDDPFSACIAFETSYGFSHFPRGQFAPRLDLEAVLDFRFVRLARRCVIIGVALFKFGWQSAPGLKMLRDIEWGGLLHHLEANVSNFTVLVGEGSHAVMRVLFQPVYQGKRKRRTRPTIIFRFRPYLAGLYYDLPKAVLRSGLIRCDDILGDRDQITLVSEEFQRDAGEHLRIPAHNVARFERRLHLHLDRGEHQLTV